MIKILFGNKPIFLCKDYKEFIDKNKLNNALIVFSLNEEKVIDYLDLLLSSDIRSMIISGDEFSNINILKKVIKNIIAGGGVVINDKKECLLIFRRGKWDLPKGKYEDDGDIIQCAIREVKEETGIQNIILEKKFYTSYHIYIENEYILKETHWYLMKTNETHLIPQLEEGITKAKWLHISNLHLLKNKTYISIYDIILKLQKHFNEKTPPIKEGRLKKSHK